MIKIGIRFSVLSIIVLMMLQLVGPIGNSVLNSPVEIGAPSVESDPIDTNIMGDDEAENTDFAASSSRSRAGGYQLSLPAPLSLPEVDGSWIQGDWSGGSGQADWSADDRYESGEDVNDNFINGHLELEKDQIIEAWQQLADAPGARSRPSAVFDPVSKQVLVHGGFAGWGGARNTTFAYNTITDTWSTKRPHDPGRVGHSAVWDTANNVMLMFGGRDSTDNMFDDLLAYNPGNNSWYKLNSSGPSGRSYHSAVFDSYRSEMIVFGGYDGDWRNPLRDVWVYNLTNDNWTQKANFTRHAYHGALWYPPDGLMYVYGGSSYWTQSEGNTYIPSVSVYNSVTDTWVNKTDSLERSRPIMAFDNLEQRIIVYGGEKDEAVNDTRFYYPATDEWVTSVDGPRARYYGAGAWDSFNYRLIYFGGQRWQTTYNETWVYSPYTPAYGANGTIISSTFDAGTQVIFRKLSFTTNDIVPEMGTQPARLQFAAAASTTSSWSYLGPDGTGNTYFTASAGTTIPADLDGGQYMKYYLNLSTEDLLVSPEFRSIRIDYYTYNFSDTYESEVYNFKTGGFEPDHAIHKVEWNAALPAGTDAKFYLRYGGSASDILTNGWEELTNGQQKFDTAPMDHFQYRVVLSSTDPIQTPVVNELTFTLNQMPGQPTSLFPGNGSHYHSATPEFTWAFTDPDGLDTDSQMAYDLQVSFREEFDFFNYESGVISTNISSCKINNELDDGWYYWRVRTDDNYWTWGPWSPVYRIYIDTTPPAAPEIRSITHAFSGTWYSLSTVIFDWDAASDISGIAGYSYTINTTDDDEPPETVMLSSNDLTLKSADEIFEGLVRYDNLDDGVWYFQLRASDTMGHWGSASSLTLKIDASAPTVTDLSDEQATTGEALAFEFEIEDEHSGLSSAELAWRYEGELEYQKEFVTITNEDTADFSYTMLDMDVDLVEYYLEVTDSAVPANTYRYPGGQTATVPLSDNDAPVIINATGDLGQDITKGMTVFMKAKDNIDVASAEIFLAGEVSGRPMHEVTNDAFEFTMNVDQVSELFQAGATKQVTYYITADDGSNNSARLPAAGGYTITLTDTAVDDTTGGDKDDKKTVVEGLSYPIAAGIIAAIIVVLLLFMFMMLKKQKEKIEEEQSKLRMSILGTETTAAPAPVTPGMELAGMDGIQPAQLPPAFPEQQMPPGLPPGDMSGEMQPTEYGEQPEDLFDEEQVMQQEPIEEQQEAEGEQETEDLEFKGPAKNDDS